MPRLARFRSFASASFGRSSRLPLVGFVPAPLLAGARARPVAAPAGARARSLGRPRLAALGRSFVASASGPCDYPARLAASLLCVAWRQPARRAARRPLYFGSARRLASGGRASAFSASRRSAVPHRAAVLARRPAAPAARGALGVGRHPQAPRVVHSFPPQEEKAGSNFFSVSASGVTTTQGPLPLSPESRRSHAGKSCFAQRQA